MELKFFSCLLLSLVALASAQHSDGQKCKRGEFWNTDASECIECDICKTHPKTPYCETCDWMENSDFDVWMVVALVSLSLIVVIATVVLGVYLQQWRENRSASLSEPIEETAGPLYPGP
ncbi:hypothetical protein AOXY_G30686 [Acipenser oxyrinchus oxyrinchus]|uniref:Tumor necrosis factor receptor superfamily member 12A n=1 Tax=Acipenser oxyrinchus oxyrinchus TaxID=40147 RepID=A0AAD8CK54_ACIOX|nr:hypothetical protein AOXY_G30686 [Acipenser oxyrinchus oxyrinchus]